MRHGLSKAELDNSAKHFSFSRSLIEFGSESVLTFLFFGNYFYDFVYGFGDSTAGNKVNDRFHDSVYSNKSDKEYPYRIGGNPETHNAGNQNMARY